eukprot:14940939-Heterocapsa_arctica.AAC.1
MRTSPSESSSGIPPRVLILGSSRKTHLGPTRATPERGHPELLRRPVSTSQASTRAGVRAR